MPKILVVDDSATDRSLAGDLLNRAFAVEIDFARQGDEALALMNQCAPDLVLTDLMMPDLDGLGLVAEVRGRFPMVPVVLMTSPGSEELALQALKLGASSYVPKRLLAEELVDTVDQVLGAARQRRDQARLMECLTLCRQQFVLGNDYTLIPPLIACLQQAATQLNLFGDADRIRMGIALEEALVNAIYHGNLEMDSRHREDRATYQKLVAHRQSSEPYCRRRVHVDMAVSKCEAKVVIRDEGPGFDPATIPDPREADLEQISGRGLLLMRTFMDEIRFNDQGNEVTMIKRASRTTA